MAPTVSLEDKIAFFARLDELDEHAGHSPESSFRARDYCKRQKIGHNGKPDNTKKLVGSGQHSKHLIQDAARSQQKSTIEPDARRKPVYQGIESPKATGLTESRTKSYTASTPTPKDTISTIILPSEQTEILDESTESESEDIAKFVTSLNARPRARSVELIGTITTHSGVENSANINRPPAQPPRRTNSKRQGRSEKARLSTTTSNTVGLFAGICFYFLPNDDVNKVRRLRIQAAVAQGARWVRSLDPCLTHIIVEEDISAEAVMKFIDTKVDLNRVVVVKDKWLQESMAWKELRDPEQGRFQLRGALNVFPKRQRVEQIPSQDDEARKAKGSISCIHGVSDPQAEEQAVEFRVGQPCSDMLIQAGAYRVRRNSMIAVPQLQHRVSKVSEDELTKTIHEVHDFPMVSVDDFNVHELMSDISQEDLPLTADELQQSKAQNSGFQCMTANTVDTDRDNPNARTISILQRMASIYDRTGDSWRSLAYRKAIGALRKQTALTVTAAQAQAVPTIGPRLARKIEEIATTDHLTRLEYAQSDPLTQTLELFMNIYGVGPKQAHAFVAKGWRTLNDLHMNFDQLSTNQQIGLEHYEDFLQRIPRVEVEQHAAVVTEALRKVDKDVKVVIGGSYRRGSPDSGDIDLIITHTRQGTTIGRLCSVVIDAVIPELFANGFLKAALATHSSRDSNTKSVLVSPGGTSADDPGTKWHGASCLPSSTVWRRIDLLLVPPAELGAALIYFTGNDIFNRSMRLLASRKGMRLNQRGLYKNVARGKGRQKLTDEGLVEARSEKKIFALLGVPWREPYEREC